MPYATLSRRNLLVGSALAGAAALGRSGDARAEEAAPVYNTPSDVQPREPDFSYAFNRTEDEWRAALTEDEYWILREGGTERPKSSPLWNERRDGDYRCKGCDLLIYSSDYKKELRKGWVFFKQCEPDATLTGIDLVTQYGRRQRQQTMMEVHCRNCGSYLGHMVYLSGDVLHCINGAALTFREA
ncbi:MAG: peptide-methionine (R)-S-oxide reductase [Pseudomonadota bacterium]